MVQRISNYERQPRDLYETPEWVTHALLRSKLVPFYKLQWWEPACASGKIAREVNAVYASDIVTGYGMVLDFLTTTDVPQASTLLSRTHLSIRWPRSLFDTDLSL
jgi:hypothetical protein